MVCSSGPPNDGVDLEYDFEGVSVIDDFKYNKDLCTRYGVKFNQCLWEIFPITEHYINKLVPANHWCNEKVVEYMTNKKTLHALLLVCGKYTSCLRSRQLVSVCNLLIVALRY